MKLAVIAASLILAGSAQAQSLKEKYELSERCGKQAAAEFAKDWGPGTVFNKGKTIARYENHYNSRLNKCFYIEVSDTYEPGKPPIRALRLYDLHENRELAGYVNLGVPLPVHCYVEQKPCEREEEWRALIKPFMED
jgi:hypothetical protein